MRGILAAIWGRAAPALGSPYWRGAAPDLALSDQFGEWHRHRNAEQADPKMCLKDKWLFTMQGEPIFCIAGIWRAHPQVGDAFTMLTMPPGPDIVPDHDRQIAVLDRSRWGDWLDPAIPAADLLRSLPAGSREVVKVG